MGNNYNVPIQGSYSENTRTKLTPDIKLTSNELLQIINSQTSAKAIADKEAKDKATRLSKSESAYQKRIKTGIQSSQDLADETGAIGDKISLQKLPIIGNYIPEILDVTGMIGNMASGLGRVPLNVEKGYYGQVALSIATPLTVGALAGVGTQNTGQFVNNLANPLAGTGDLVNNLGNKYLPNIYKLNPRSFKPNSNNFYRQVDNTTYNEALESGLIRGKQDIDMTSGEGIINLNKAFGDDAYYNKGSLYYKENKNLPYLFEAKLGEESFIPKVNGRTRKYTTENTSVRVSKKPLSINNPNITIYKKDWLQGYKQVEVPKSNFKSEINWGQWNKEIPDNPQLMKEYNAIEQTSKANNTWMKNPDGSVFQGTPEQFVQQNSENFKKAFPNILENKNNSNIFYHGSPETFTSFDKTKFGKSDMGSLGRGNYITDSKSYAELYAKPEGYPMLEQFKNPKGNIYELYANAPNIEKTSGLSKQQIRSLKGKDVENIVYGDSDYLNQGFKGNSDIVVPFSSNLKSATGNNGMFDMTNPNIYKTIVGALATGTLGKQAMEKKELGGYVRTSKSGRKFTYPSFEEKKQEIINRILTK